MAPPTRREIIDQDVRDLARLGYAQQLYREMGGFSNFAISFSIISILAGCFTNFGAGFNNGGPISISWSWPILSVFILIIGFTMSELVSAYPTSGGIYWWASKLGGAAAGFFTGWLNLIGLIAVASLFPVALLQQKTQTLQEAFHKVSEQMYAAAAQQQAEASGNGAAEDGAGAGSDDEEVVDAEVVDGDK